MRKTSFWRRLKELYENRKGTFDFFRSAFINFIGGWKMANSYKVIDEKTWDRAMHCNVFRNSIEPSFCVTFDTNSQSTYRQTFGYNKFIPRQAPLPGVFSHSRGRCRHYADRGADRQTSLSAGAFQGQRSDLTELILSVDFVYRTIEN